MSMFRTVPLAYQLLPRLANILAAINRMLLKPLPINKAVSSRLEMLIKFRVPVHLIKLECNSDSFSFMQSKDKLKMLQNQANAILNVIFKQINAVQLLKLNRTLSIACA